jgi:ArsR family transcriptional regulator
MSNDKLLIYIKALSDPIRLSIMSILSCGELCACEILDGLSITQTTLSHHMKILTQSGLVSKRKEATYILYKINKDDFSILQNLIGELISRKNTCLCEQVKTNKSKCK